MPLTDDPWLEYDGGGAVSPIRAATPVVVYRFTPPSTLFPLPNVRCLHVERHEGTDPGRASFRYDLSSGLEGAPTTIEEALSTESAGDYLVTPADRLVVRAQRPDGGWDCLFDGLPLDFGLGLSPDAEGTSFDAVGIAYHCWDMPISGTLQRDAGDPDTGTANTQTQRIAHFNPDGKGNATAYVEDGGTGNDVNDGTDHAHPAFIDHRVIRTPPISRVWTVEMAVRYILYTANADEDFVLNPAAADLTALLKARVPLDGEDFDPSDPGTYTAADLIVPDLPVTGKDWPTTVAKLVGDVGFQTMFRLNTDGDGLPQTVYGIYRSQAGPLKDIYLAPRGTPFDPTLFNFDGASLSRDLADVANGVVVRGAPIRHEVSVILAPGFPSESADGSQANLAKFDEGNPDFVANREKYRKYIFDETADGHYAPGSTTKVETSPSLNDLFGSGKYERQRRPGIGTLFSKGPDGRPLKAELHASTDYAGTKPGLWDGTGTWQVVAASQWNLLKDQLGIEFAQPKGNAIHAGKSKTSGHPYPAGTIKGVESQCGMSGATPFHLRLTCVIEADECRQYVADRRDESPVPWTIARVVDARDRVKKQLISRYSYLNATAPAYADRLPEVDRDDYEAAKAEAIAIQQGLQSGVMGGTVSIPRFTGYYGVGDRIASIEGRGLGFRTDGDAEGLNLIYPVVTGVRWDLDGEQRTTLTLSDAGSDRSMRRTRANRGNRAGWRRTSLGDG